MPLQVKLRDVAKAAMDDPRKALLDSLEGRHHEIEMFHNFVLVATYIEPEQTKGGIILSDRTLSENRFQGKAALVLRLGPQAFKDDGRVSFGGVTLREEEDWVMVRPSDGLELFTSDSSGRNGTSCRIFQDVNILARIKDPALVY